MAEKYIFCIFNLYFIDLFVVMKLLLLEVRSHAKLLDRKSLREDHDGFLYTSLLH